MDRYDFVFARAKEVVERQHQEKAEDNDISDQQSELSVLANNLFDGRGIYMDI